MIVERAVTDIDEIVRIVRFDGWQHTEAGEREVKKALRSTLLKYKLHKNHEALRQRLRVHPPVLLTFSGWVDILTSRVPSPE